MGTAQRWGAHTLAAASSDRVSHQVCSLLHETLGMCSIQQRWDETCVTV